ncbi:MAG TPA: 1,4-dihydroxy-2-naphthoate octaprenyltransferase [Ignavibacteria bacterium]|nr:1,4-dihydroxy-2-naphthoate octaprenyltransferase [Ignavibacteria bacterium]HQY52061.1 1,4-dihydroxy-2-naphthoate octaprenyltransferase [Ignavibacteria bacterium]HRB01563.1 1,4-dihydroxy-2-naphthoate octaprenyltransferase [Ignavibacteria bacterium]
MTETIQKPAGLKLWLMAARAYSFPASIIPVLLGSVLAVLLNPGLHFNILNFGLTLVGCILVQVGTNLINDIFDFDKGIDKEDKELGIPHGGSMVISLGFVTIKQMKTAAFFSLLISFLIGVYLFTQAGMWILYLSIFGLLSAVFYTAKPLALKYKALGDLQVIISFGVGMTLGSYIVQTGEFSIMPVIISIPLGLLIDAILHSNNIRDINFDGKFGVKTLPILIGEKLSVKFYYFLILGAYLAVLLFVVLNILPWFALLSFITLPLALKLVKMSEGFPSDTQARFEYGTKHIMMTAQLNMMFGLTLVIGLLVSYLFFT